MSTDTSDKRPSAKLPNVVLYVAGFQEILEQDYPNIIINRYGGDIPTDNDARYFNYELDNCYEEADSIFGFLSARDNFLTPDAVSTIVDKITKHPSIDVIYADTYIKTQDSLLAQFFPAFHPNLITTDLLMNGPVFVSNVPATARFNEDFEYIYHHIFLMTLAKTKMVAHIADPLFVSSNPSGIDSQAELEKFSKWLTTQHVM
jgi:hypothetical protein